MGYDAGCTLTYDGRTSRGTAVLEQKELIFRGPTRLAIPLASIRSATARDGTLLVRFGTQTAKFAIGTTAAKWAARITNPPSRIDKLGVKEGMTIATLGIADAAFLDEVSARAGRVLRSLPSGAVDIIVYGANRREALSKLDSLSQHVQPNGALWIVRPKGRPEITESETMAAGKRAGLVDVKVVSFSETHTAEKFVIPVAKRSGARG